MDPVTRRAAGASATAAPSSQQASQQQPRRARRAEELSIEAQLLVGARLLAQGTGAEGDSDAEEDAEEGTTVGLSKAGRYTAISLLVHLTQALPAERQPAINAAVALMHLSLDRARRAACAACAASLASRSRFPHTQPPTSAQWWQPTG